MKQVDFIQLLSCKLPEIFKTEQLLLALTESSSSKITQRDLRKCMHNHLSRLENQSLIKRLSPKRTRNASFKRLFNFDSVNIDLLDSPLEVTKDSQHTTLSKQHISKLQKDSDILNRKRLLLSKLAESHEVYESIIGQKLADLDSQLLDNKIELEVIGDLLNAIEIKSSQI